MPLNIMGEKDKFICQACHEEFDTEKGLHIHLKKHQMDLATYYTTYYPRKNLLTGDPLPFKNKEEGDAFRKWFRENPAYEYWANLWEIDETGPYNNTYIKKAYNLIAGGKTAGEFYKEHLENPTDNTSAPPVSD